MRSKSTTRHTLRTTQATKANSLGEEVSVRSHNFTFLLLAISLWAISSLPVIIYSKMFPLDTADIFLIGKNLGSWLHWIASPYNGSGRYFPFYWLYHAIQFQFFGIQVGAYLAVQSAIFLAASALTCLAIARFTRDWRYSALLLILIYTSSPLAENLSTIGKAEILTYFLFIATVSIFYAYQIKGKSLPILAGLAVAILFAVSILTKETSIVLLGFAATGAVASGAIHLILKNRPARALAKTYFLLFGYLVLGLAFTRIPYIFFKRSTTDASYTAYDITWELLGENFHFYATQQPDVLVCGLFSVILLTFIARDILTANNRTQLSIDGFVFATSVCATGWAYYLALMVWRWPMGYYMLAPAILFKLCCVYGIFIAGSRLPTPRKLLRSVYATFVACILFGICYIYYVTFSQVAYSRMYTEAVLKYKALSNDDTNLVIESYPFYAQQIGVTSIFLSFDGQTKASVKGIADLLDPAAVNSQLISILNISQNDIEKNIQSLPKKGDYLLVFTGNKLATWALRGVTPYYNQDSLLKAQHSYDMQLVDQDSITNPAIYINTWTNRPQAGNTFVGYKLYRILNDEPKFFWKGRYPDGWIGKTASLQINRQYDEPVQVRLSAPPFALPNRVVISKNGTPVEAIELTDTNETVLNLREQAVSQDVFDFSVERAVSPKSIKLNQDKRELSVRITLDSAGAPAR
ncbi:hypothetical protein D8I24_5553 [Cupriavidus necator H850]|uniref:ArnT family glycosyltransferase n=1 Tax=Cupriavidus necator TaxID=106590 RepID=UPI00129E66DA|nr:hypothetical protein [Cupriavidus necator]KAI3598607.1 hypothetical protein D8I24_5553 [Cupriavidus necator H850]